MMMQKLMTFRMTKLEDDQSINIQNSSDVSVLEDFHDS